MFDLLCKKQPLEKMIVHDAKWINKLPLIEKEINKIVHYYMDKKESIDKPNPLINLLNSFSINPEKSEYEIKHYLDIQAPFTSKIIDMVSDINYGKYQEGKILKGSYEIYLYVNKINRDLNEKNYKTYRSIYIKYSTIKQILVNHPAKLDVGNYVNDLVIYEIDVIGLGLQYYYWMKEQISLEANIDVAEFLFRIPLSNLIYDLFNHSVINYILSSKNVPINITNKPVISTIIPTSIIQDMVSTYKDIIKSYGNLSLISILNNIPLLKNETGYSIFKYSPNIWTMQNISIPFTSSIYLINRWISLSPANILKTKNDLTTYINDIKQIRNDKVYFKQLPVNLAYDLHKKSKKILDFIRR